MFKLHISQFAEGRKRVFTLEFFIGWPMHINSINSKNETMVVKYFLKFFRR